MREKKSQKMKNPKNEHSRSNCCLLLHNTMITQFLVKKWYRSSKSTNSLMHAMNGNGKKAIDITHWNLGSKLWFNKSVHIQLLVDEKCPDILFISEANIYDYMEDHELLIDGYTLLLPKTMQKFGYARLALLVKNGTELKIQQQWMSPIVSSIWLKLGGRGSKNNLWGVFTENTLCLTNLPPTFLPWTLNNTKGGLFSLSNGN